MTTKTFDVLILGKGVLGLAIALELAMRDPTLTIGLLGEDSGASHAAGAMLGCYGEITRRTMMTDASRAKFQASRAATGAWPAWAGKIGDLAGTAVNLQLGTYVINNAESGLLDDYTFAAIEAALRADDEPFEHVAADDIAGLDATARSRPLRALFIPGEGSTDARQLLTRLREAVARSPSVCVMAGRARTCVIERSRVSYVLAMDGSKLSAGNVIVAAGYATSKVMSDIPVVAARMPAVIAGTGTALELRETQTSLAHVIRTPNRAFACGLHLVPQGDGAAYLGATNWPSLTPVVAPMASDVHFLLTCALTQISRRLHYSRIARWHCGNRPISLDTLPLVGGTSVGGLWVATGTYRDGFHMAPIFADAIARAVLGDQSGLEPLFAPERPLVAQWSQETAIEEAVLHYMAALHERVSMFPAGWEEAVLEALIRDAIVRLYGRLDFGPAFTLPPDFIGALIHSPEAVPAFHGYVRANMAAWSGAA